MNEIGLVELRHELHRYAEIAHNERKTAAVIQHALEQMQPDALHTHLGGYGLAAEFRGASPGPSLLLRAELDALPITEQNDLPYRSQTAGQAHQCGHDGHMAILIGLAQQLRAARPARGRVVLLFQPAEETGEGARRVLDDPAFAAIRPDWTFALHNLPGHPLGHVIVRTGTFACGSRGLTMQYRGATSHAAEPEAGRSPVRAMAQLMEAITTLPEMRTDPEALALATVIHARLGEVAFGTTPGEGVVMVTLRGATESVIDRLEVACREQAQQLAQEHRLELHIEQREPFPVTVNAREAAAAVRHAGKAAGLMIVDLPHPFRWSEDFGHFTSLCKGALFGLGAGVESPALHHPTYDFPDALIVPGIKVLDELVRFIGTQ